jgi:acyl carrier protein
MQSRIRADIREYIVSTWLSGDERGFDDDTDLQASGILDSFALLDMTAFLSGAFKVQLEPSDINAETFSSVNTIARLVLEKLSTKTS